MFKWFTQLSTVEKRTFWACFSGWGLDAMDTQMYALAIPTLIALWGAPVFAKSLLQKDRKPVSVWQVFAAQSRGTALKAILLTFGIYGGNYLTSSPG